MRMTIHARNPDSFNMIAAKVQVKSLREASPTDLYCSHGNSR